MRLDPVGKAQQSVTKSKIRCYHVVITTGEKSQCFSPIYDNIYLEKNIFLCTYAQDLPAVNILAIEQQ